MLGAALYGQMPAYLDFAEEALKTAAVTPDFKRRLLESFPDYGGLKVIGHRMRFLF